MFRLMATSTALLSFTDHDEASLVNVEADFSTANDDGAFCNCHDYSDFIKAVVDPAVQVLRGGVANDCRKKLNTEKRRKYAVSENTESTI